MVLVNMTFEIGLHVGGGRKYGRTEGHVITKISCVHRDSWCSAARASRAQEFGYKICHTRNRSRVCLFWTTKNEEIPVLKTIMANYGWN